MSRKYAELCHEIKNLIECNSIKVIGYEKDFVKIKFNLDDNLSMNKILKLHNMSSMVVEVIRTFFLFLQEHFTSIKSIKSKKKT